MSKKVGTGSINLSLIKASPLVKKAKEYAIKCHTETNHLYAGKPYDFHLRMVVDYACKYARLVESNNAAELKSKLETIIASAWVHDTIEDCRQTYNDVKSELGLHVAEIAYALTNEKGRNRKERANGFYYAGIRDTPSATYVKLCDRLANVAYAKSQGNRMIETYRKEHEYFMKQLSCMGYKPMWDELAEMLG